MHRPEFLRNAEERDSVAPKGYRLGDPRLASGTYGDVYELVPVDEGTSPSAKMVLKVGIYEHQQPPVKQTLLLRTVREVVIAKHFSNVAPTHEEVSSMFPSKSSSGGGWFSGIRSIF